MNAPHALATRPPSLVHGDEQTGLTALLELFSAEEPATGTAVARPSAWPPLRVTLRAIFVRLVERTRASSRRAASWGAGPQGAWRAW